MKRKRKPRGRHGRREGHIVEPDGFRTDFVGSSTELRDGRPECDATVGATVRFQHPAMAKQPR
jgi:hypothetical protein